MAAARWNNVLEFCDWMAQRRGQIEDAVSTSTHTEIKSLLEVAQNIALLSTISERESEQDQVVLSTLHASKGAGWPRVQLVGVTEGMLPFKLDDDDGKAAARQRRNRRPPAGRAPPDVRGHHPPSARWSAGPSAAKGRDTVPCQPNRFIAEMQLDPLPAAKILDKFASCGLNLRPAKGSNPTCAIKTVLMTFPLPLCFQPWGAARPQRPSAQATSATVTAPPPLALDTWRQCAATDNQARLAC